MEQGIKLNLGCGKKLMPGFINVDFQPKEAGVQVHDLTKPLPWKNCDEIHAYHVFEHFLRYEAEDILQNWIDALRPGGLLVLELPCLDKVLSLFQHHIQKKIPIGPWVVHGLFGDPSHKDPAMTHRWCYSVGELSALMRMKGLKVELKEAQTHVPVRDMRLEGRK